MGKYNIWSGNKDWPLGAALTNCTCLAHKKGNIKNQYPVSFQGVIWEDAEQAYISLSRRCRDYGARDKLMVNIIAAKLKQHPQLKTLVDRYGGIAFLERCEHTTYAQSERFRKWEGVGRESRFIRNLIAAYLVAVVEAVPLTPQRYSLLSPPQRRQLRGDYAAAQRGICLYCNVPLTTQPPRRIVDYPVDWSLFPAVFLNHPVHLQHCHKTDMTEGAVHAVCNAVMWVLEGR
ncbi:MAG: hypothetical protein E6Q97_20650 [Desulfurellales bacterium]|nr:MAG: hypothetical protein E6Q97_20650 [Desulfurellales bacterium]